MYTWKNCLQKSIGFIHDKNISETCLGKKKYHLSNKGKAVLSKNLIGYMNRVDWDIFPYDSNVDDDQYLSDTLGDTDSDVKNTLKTFHKNNMDKIIFTHLKISSIRNKFDQLSNMITGNIGIPNDIVI